MGRIGRPAVPLLVALALSVPTVGAAGGPVKKEEAKRMHDYGTRVRFAPDTTLAFADLSLRYLGPRRVDTRPVYPHGFLYHDFEARTGQETTPVSWSSGTGSIAPVEFGLAGRTYVLELGASVLSDKVLAPDELVLWPAALHKAADLPRLLLAWRPDAALRHDRRDGSQRELRLQVREGEAIVRVRVFEAPLPAFQHFDGAASALTPAGTNPRVSVPDGNLWANRAAPDDPVLLWHKRSVFAISGVLALHERVSLGRWLAHEMAGEYRAEEVADESTLWLLLKLKALVDLHALPEAEAAAVRNGAAPFRQSVPVPADHACRLHDRTRRGYHMVAGGWTEIVNPATGAALKIEKLDLHRIERHGQRFSAAQAQFLEKLP
jgi:hypothetical protein